MALIRADLDLDPFGILMWEVYCAQAVFEVHGNDQGRSEILGARI